MKGIVQPGFPLKLNLLVWAYDNLTGRLFPLKGAIADIWQANSLGYYSDEAIQGTSGQKFLRGTQVANAAGKVLFTTVYPGWYSGRTPHIHFRARVLNTATNAVAYNFMSQLFFSEAITNAIFSSVYPYTLRPGRDTFNATDGIFTGASTDDELTVNTGSHLLLSLTGDYRGLTGTFNVVLDLSDAGDNNATGGFGGGPGGPPPARSRPRPPVAGRAGATTIPSMTGPHAPPFRTRIDRPGPPRLDFLDGLRGLAALYVVAYHAADWTAWGGLSLERRPAFGLGLLAHGHAAVGVFIVLSGFCLMRPAVRAGGVLDGGVAGYLRRRARRILPPYYAATLLSLALIATVPALGRPSGTAWDGCLPAFRSRTLLAHALLTHNLDPRHRLKINAPHWSVATEWQIYFALPLLIPVWKRLGMGATVALAFAVGVLPHLVLPPGHNYDTACPWYLGLFALGMAAAVLEGSAWRDRAPWRVVSAIGCAGLAIVLLDAQHDGPRRDLPGAVGYVLYWGRPLWVRDAFLGLVTAASIVALAQDSAEGRRPIGLSLLRSRPALAVGTISYSLYLTHYPVLALIHAATGGGRSTADAARLLALGVPAALLAAGGFHGLVERRFLGGRSTPRLGRGLRRDRHAEHPGSTALKSKRDRTAAPPKTA